MQTLEWKVMRAVHNATLIFEVSKVNFEVHTDKLFGLIIAKKCCFYKKLEYDLLLEAETNTNVKTVEGFYDFETSNPPYKLSYIIKDYIIIWAYPYKRMV